jgi:hypothetical protein
VALIGRPRISKSVFRLGLDRIWQIFGNRDAFGTGLRAVLEWINRRYRAGFNGSLVNHCLDEMECIGTHIDDASLSPGADVVSDFVGAEHS